MKVSTAFRLSCTAALSRTVPSLPGVRMITSKCRSLPRTYPAWPDRCHSHWASRVEHSHASAECGRRIWQQVQPRPLDVSWRRPSRRWPVVLPVKMMLDRRAELEIAGCASVGVRRIKVGAIKQAVPSWPGIQLLGHRRSRWWWHVADPIRLRYSQSAHEHTAVATNVGPAVRGVHRITRKQRCSPCAHSKMLGRHRTWIPTISS